MNDKCSKSDQGFWKDLKNSKITSNNIQLWVSHYHLVFVTYIIWEHNGDEEQIDATTRKII